MKSLVLVAFLFLCLVNSSKGQVITANQGVDLTLVGGSSGEEVVDASLFKLELVTFSNDFGLMKRIALVESNFGQTGSTSSSKGGIWQITNSMYNVISSPSNLLQFSLEIAEAGLKLGLSVVDWTSDDFSVPMRSAFAARMFMLNKLENKDQPVTLEEQAKWWSTKYNPSGSGGEQFFIDTVQAYEGNNNCTASLLDLWFLIDGSGSIGSSNFQTTLDFVEQMADGFEIASDKVRTGLSVYSSSYYPESDLNEHMSNSQFRNAVRSTNYPRGGTSTGNGIRRVVNDGFQTSAGARPLAQGVPRILIVLTDGQSGDDVLAPSNQAREEGITVYGVGIGSGVKISEINEIANDPDSQYAFPVSSFALLDVIKRTISEESCTTSVKIQDNATVSVEVPQGDTHYTTMEMPVNGSIELRYEITNIGAVGTVYLSGSVANPSSALYEISFQITVGVTVVRINEDILDKTLDLVDVVKRSRRDLGNVEKRPLYAAVKSSGTSSLDLKVKSSGSEERATGNSAAVAGASPIFICLTLLHTLLAMMYI